MSEVENPQGKEMILAGERMWVEAQWAGDMQEAIERVRELHKSYQPDLLSPNHLMCEECSGINNGGFPALFVKYPCETIKALDGEQDVA